MTDKPHRSKPSTMINPADPLEKQLQAFESGMRAYVASELDRFARITERLEVRIKPKSPEDAARIIEAIKEVLRS